MPSARPEDRKKYDEEIELTAVRLAQAYEEAHGANVRDVDSALAEPLASRTAPASISCPAA
jgi:hypothetical protein